MEQYYIEEPIKLNGRVFYLVEEAKKSAQNNKKSFKKVFVKPAKTKPSAEPVVEIIDAEAPLEPVDHYQPAELYAIANKLRQRVRDERQKNRVLFKYAQLVVVTAGVVAITALLVR